MIEVGRMIMKIAGRDAGKIGVVLKVIDDNYIFIDGEVRRRKCNIYHIEPLNKVLKIKEDESNAKVVKAFKDAGYEINEKKESTKKTVPRPKKIRKKKEHVELKKKPIKKKATKEEKITKKDAAVEMKKIDKVEEVAKELKPKTKVEKEIVNEIKEQVEEVKGEILEGKTDKKVIDKEIETIKKEEESVKKTKKSPKKE